MSNFRRSWSEVGERAQLPQKQAFTNSYLFSAVAPLSGESFHLMCFDEMDTTSQFLFLTELKKQHSDTEVVVVWDNAPCHRPKLLRNIPGLTLINLPSYSPQLNPTERFFEEIRRATSNEIHETLADIEARIEKTVKTFSENTEAMKQLLGYEWIKKQMGYS